ncbi:hypothetical protein RIF29_14774 [Crotalaria pallida]|uniref:Uncharacterized protein n=1 Tax=Crotalaria pallida TaxID=3830 RepID=A0AAN9ID16_CROPI
MMQNSTQNSVPNDDDIDIDAALPSSVSTIEDGKREGEDELEKLVSAKKRKIDEVSEKQKNVKEIGSDDSTSYPEQDQKSAKYGMREKKVSIYVP